MLNMAYNGRLTSLSHGGGCGCKIAPGLLREILQSSSLKNFPLALLAGSENNEDAAVYQINASQAIVATTDFFMPIVDDPFDFGRIAATNAISDVYAMGGKPLFALALLGMPINVLPVDTIQNITLGGEAACADAGIPIAGGHSIDTVEPIYGLVVIGLVDPSRLKRNSGAQVGDSIILGKPLGIGIMSAALKKELLSEDGYRQMIFYTTQLNKPGFDLAQLAGIHALTDVTGFGLAGHLLEVSRGSKLQAAIHMSKVPVIPEALALAKQNVVTGASGRNWKGYGSEIQMSQGLSEWERTILTDPQTSGGLLISCAPESELEVMGILKSNGFSMACKIGEFNEGSGLSVF